jgi:hypothetical protein
MQRGQRITEVMNATMTADMFPARTVWTYQQRVKTRATGEQLFHIHLGQVLVLISVYAPRVKATSTVAMLASVNTDSAGFTLLH